jgi:glutaminyl-tRNA synthetase
MDAVNNPEKPEEGTRKVPFSKIIYIEQEDFMEVPSNKYYRLSPGKEVRLRYAYFIKCESVVKDENTGEILEVHCTYDPASRGGNSPDGRKVKSTIHWVSEKNSYRAKVNLYDNLFTKEDLGDLEEGKNYLDYLNPNSNEVVEAWIEPALKDARPGDKFQFERLGYFVADSIDSKQGEPIFNRTVGLRDSFAKMKEKK